MTTASPEELKMPELLPCPLCEATVAECLPDSYLDPDNVNDDTFTVICSMDKGGCGTASGYRESREAAMALWNRRHTSQLHAELAKARACINYADELCWDEDELGTKETWRSAHQAAILAAGGGKR